MKKSIKTILAGMFCFIAVIGTAKAEEHCGYFYFGADGKTAYFQVLKEDLEAGMNVTGKCCGQWCRNAQVVEVSIFGQYAYKRWIPYDGLTIHIEGDIEKRPNGAIYLYDPKFLYEN